MTRFCLSLALTALLAGQALAQQPEQATQQATLAQEPARLVGCRAVVTTQPDSEPLYVIDGQISTTEQLRALPPADIYEVALLKPAPAAALYGSRAQRGVVVVTTKRPTGRKASGRGFKYQQQQPDRSPLVQP